VLQLLNAPAVLASGPAVGVKGSAPGSHLRPSQCWHEPESDLLAAAALTDIARLCSCL